MQIATGVSVPMNDQSTSETQLKYWKSVSAPHAMPCHALPVDLILRIFGRYCRSHPSQLTSGLVAIRRSGEEAGARRSSR